MDVRDRRKGHSPSARTVWRCTFGTAPRDGSVESQEWVDTLNRKVRAKRETFPWRGSAETRGHRRDRHRYERNLLKQKRKRKRKVLEESLISVCPSHAPLSLEAAARQVVRGCITGGGKEGSRYQTCFNVVHIGCSVQSRGSMLSHEGRGQKGHTPVPAVRSQ